MDKFFRLLLLKIFNLFKIKPTLRKRFEILKMSTAIVAS